MGKQDKRVDAYIASSADFAKPILKHLRELVHKACPDVEETMKWSFPHFDYKGMMCSMASFKEHCAFGFWKATLIPELNEKLQQVGKTAMGHFGNLRSLKDLPPDKTLIGYIKKAAALNDAGVKIPAKPKSGERSKDVSVPADLTAALKKNKKARETFEGFSPSHKREYTEWIADAKSAETKNKRLATTMEWLAEGKSRHWKYAKK
jgi:uncharacterized protein YdeI (YjbR/CyaY-like superfamily)